MYRAAIVATALAFCLSGCLENDGQRGLAGAAGGAVVAGAVGGNPVAGAVIGGVGGLACHDLGVKACRNK